MLTSPFWLYSSISLTKQKFPDNKDYFSLASSLKQNLPFHQASCYPQILSHHFVLGSSLQLKMLTLHPSQQPTRSLPPLMIFHWWSAYVICKSLLPLNCDQPLCVECESHTELPLHTPPQIAYNSCIVQCLVCLSHHNPTQQTAGHQVPYSTDQFCPSHVVRKKLSQ